VNATLVALTCLVLAAPAAAKSPSGAHQRPKAKPVEPPAGYVALASAPELVTKLRLPFDGAWGVLQGTSSDGTHSGYAAYALDFVPAEPDAASLTRAVFRKRKRLSDHPCYGRPVLAPAAGRVTWANDGARELPPFRSTRKHEAGNFVIIEHQPGEYSEFRHLQRGSLTVKVGDTVTAGQIIGRCGNSGGAVTPHLHFAVLGSCDPIATRPFGFASYDVLVDGRWQRGGGMPKQGDIVRPSPGSGD
jgi:hypothetical protein